MYFKYTCIARAKEKLPASTYSFSFSRSQSAEKLGRIFIRIIERE